MNPLCYSITANEKISKTKLYNMYSSIIYFDPYMVVLGTGTQSKKVNAIKQSPIANHHTDV